ncbi:MAG TPA: XrtA-associated tyrosine autokinase [Geobacteraceae bacterium]|nr:XrtA-associated tyrosine autokinase [Geobacteraceae bacterium]
MSRIEKALEKAAQLRNRSVSEEVREEIREPGVVVPEAFAADQPPTITSPYLVTVQDPHCPISEEYRKLKSLIVRTTREKFLNTIMVTSTCKGEGKTITALNLAISLAQEFDHTVLLVDADLRQPSVTRYLGIQAEPGLSDCLSNGRDVGDALVKTGIGKMVVLPAGKAMANPVELLSSGRMKQLVHELKNRYRDRYIIIDTPPILHFAEAHAIGSCVDGVVFVVGEGQAPISDVKESMRMLKDCQMLGVVYNNVASARFTEGYNYRYHYKYYHKASEGY